VRNGFFRAFRCVRQAERVTHEMTEDIEFVHGMIDTNLTFMKSNPNSVQYWSNRKKDLFAMIRQLCKPTAFLTMGANETR
jgi:hypothetical protein